VDHLDILFGPDKVAVLQRIEPEIRASGCCFITEAGYHPGLPSALVRYAADCLGTVRSAVVGGLIHHPLPYTEAVDDLIRSLETTRPALYRDGAWHEVSWTTTRRFDFGEPYGTCTCSPMDFHEMRELPELLDLQETGFYIGSMGWLADWLVFTPWVLFKLGRTRRGARLGGKLLAWATRVGLRPPYGVVLKLEAEGISEDGPVHLDVFLRHEDGYLFTAIPVVACVKQMLDGSIRKPGLWLMGHAVQPIRLLADMEAMGIEIVQHTLSDQTSG
jgi:saccharopine dehydrogenase (NAD+, L-lysine-forming)